MLESELGERCKSFVADKCLDTDELRKIFYRHGVTTAMDVRRMWQEAAVEEGFRHPTRSLVEGRIDTMFHDEVGTLYCKWPEIRQSSADVVLRSGEKMRHTEVSLSGVRH